jgi:hypothetical protein
MDDGSYLGTFKYYDALQPSRRRPAVGAGPRPPSKDLLQTYGDLHGRHLRALPEGGGGRARGEVAKAAC